MVAAAQSNTRGPLDPFPQLRRFHAWSGACAANAFSSSRTAGISLDFASTATCPRTAPMPCASAATRCGAFPALSFAPRTVLPSIAITSRPPARTALVCSQAPRTGRAHLG